MRVAVYVAALVAFAVLNPVLVENVLASMAGIILECLPYLCASRILATATGGRARTLLAYAGCGCGSGPSARSIPAAVAVAWLFGPWVALARLAAASLAAFRTGSDQHIHDISLASELATLAPSALCAALIATLAPELHVSTQPLVVQIACGCVLGVLASPCALGGVALAASLHASAPAAALAVLATAGIVDIHHRLPRLHVRGDDSLAYVAIACACALVAFEGGRGLVNPKLAPALAGCIPLFAIAAWNARGSRSLVLRAMALALTVVPIIGAPAPEYHATETTLTDVFAGESIDFTGQYLRDGRTFAVERYAITCCRADAAPVVLALQRPLPARDGAWLLVSGTFVQTGDALTLHVRSFRSLPPPRDPFIYR